jgi:hypothetical protein
MLTPVAAIKTIALDTITLFIFITASLLSCLLTYATGRYLAASSVPIVVEMSQYCGNP